jgi:lipopolysaccharide transport system ATP-binding protein
MSDTVIRVENLSKRYHIGSQQQHKKRSQSLINAVSSPFRRSAQILRGKRKSALDLSEEFWALQDISFEVKKGEVLGVIGRNGAGKSTLLKILSGITLPTNGYAEVYGQVGSLLEVGTGFHPDLTGRENVYLNGAILGISRTELNSKFDEIVEFAGVEKFIDTPVKFYSSGMYVRLAFAVAAQLQPDILIIDEVLAVGDAAFQKKALGKVDSIAESGRTVLFVSHNMVSVSHLCSRALLLENGKALLDGKPSDVIGHYLGGDIIEEKGEISWNDSRGAPGCEDLCCRSVRIRDSEDTITNLIDITKPFTVEVDYEVLKAGIQAGATVLLRSEDDTLVLGSPNINDTSWHGKEHPEGVFRSVCHIPGNLLNNGRYSISIILWEDYFKTCLAEFPVMHVEILDGVVGGVRQNYMGGWEGVIRPMLFWDTKYLGS